MSNSGKRPTRSRAIGRRALYIVALTVSLALILLAAGSVSAHPEGPAHHNPFPEHATDVMRAFADNDHAPQALAAMTTTSCEGGFAGVYPCNNVDLEAFLPLNQIGGTSGNSAANDIWGWTDSQTGKEYAIIGLVFGTSFVDISDPANPVYLGELPTHGAFGSSWRDIKVYNDHAFIVSEANNHGMQVFDLTQLRGLSGPPVTFTETAHYNQNASAHNIVINEDSGFAYIVGAAKKNNCSGGLHMVNIQDPANPSFAGCFSDDGYTHDAQCVTYSGPDADHQGKEVCFNSNEDTVTIVDVTDKSNPIQLSSTAYAGSAYTHQGWVTDDQVHFLLDDELDEQNFGHNTRTRVFDVSDLDAPTFAGSYDSGNSAIDHNQYVKGNFSYQANYRSGLRILDISNVATATLTEAAFFDIYPADDANQFNAAWSNYPYFDSGIVIVSGIEQGLFILRPNLGPVDNPPSVNVTDPAEGATVSGSSVNVAATASDDNGVTQVEFFVDGNSIGVDTTSPYSVSWDSTSVVDGAYLVSATATDTIGQTGSDSNNFTVDNLDEAPTASIVNPGEGSTVSNTVTVQVDATDDRDAAGSLTVTVSVDGGADQTATYNAGSGFYEYDWDTTAELDGPHTIDASATDSATYTTNATQVNVTVDNTVSPISLSANGYKVRGVHHADLTWSGATSTDVDVLRDGVVIVTMANNGAYTDNTGNKGGGVTYTYQVCEAGTSTCSNAASASF